MDYLKDLTNEHLKDYFLEDLKCINKVIHFWYPHSNYKNDDIEEEEDFFFMHISKCLRILKIYIVYELAKAKDLEGRKLEAFQIDDLATQKSKEIYEMCDQEVQCLWNSLKITSIHLNKKTSYYKINNFLIVGVENSSRSIFFTIHKKLKRLFTK